MSKIDYTEQMGNIISVIYVEDFILKKYLIVEEIPV